MIAFVIVVLIGIPLLHIYLWKRLIRDTMTSGRARTFATATLIAMVLVMLAALLFGTRTDPQIARWFAWPGYLWLAIFFYLFLALAVLELPRLALRGWVRRGTDLQGTTNDCEADTDVPHQRTPPSGHSRRVFLARSGALVAGVAATGIVGYGVPIAMGPPTITTVPIGLRRLDPRAAGCRIALISDIHIGPIIGRSFTQRIVDMINAERVDAVAIAGDLVDGSVADLAAATEPLADLTSTHGTFFVTGNHEYYVGYEQWVDYLPSLGIRVLRNERETIRHGGGSFDLAGINDTTGYQWQDPGDVARAVAGRDPDDAVVLIAHQPLDLDDAVGNDVDLLLAGHTHGGQMTPFEYLVTLQQGAIAGSYQVADTKMYVTKGAGFWGPPVRVGAPPDITIIELRSE